MVVTCFYENYSDNVIQWKKWVTSTRQKTFLLWNIGQQFSYIQQASEICLGHILDLFFKCHTIFQLAWEQLGTLSFISFYFLLKMTSKDCTLLSLVLGVAPEKNCLNVYFENHRSEAKQKQEETQPWIKWKKKKLCIFLFRLWVNLNYNYDLWSVIYISWQCMLLLNEAVFRYFGLWTGFLELIITENTSLGPHN